MTIPANNARSAVHAGPPLWLPATMYVFLFLAGLYPVTVFGGTPYFPGPDESLDVIVNFFRLRPSAVRLCAFFQFGAAIPLGLFTATAVSQLRFLGVRAAGTYIALFGGIATAVNMLVSSAVLSVMGYPGIADQPLLIQALYRLTFALGGTGFSVPFGILVAGIAIPALIYRLVPKWIGILGMVIAIVGELSWLQTMFPQLLPLIPLTRFPGFIWIIAVGVALPRTRA
jgi:hypothetical protein